MVAEVLTLPQLDEGVFIGGWESGRWKQPAGQFGGKSGAAGLWAGRSGGPPDGSGAPPKGGSE